MIKLFKIVLRLFSQSESPDWSSITIIWVQAYNVSACGKAMKMLATEEEWAQLFQIAFDLYEIASQRFVSDVRKMLKTLHVGPDPNQVCHLRAGVKQRANIDSRPSCA